MNRFGGHGRKPEHSKTNMDRTSTEHLQQLSFKPRNVSLSDNNNNHCSTMPPVSEMGMCKILLNTDLEKYTFFLRHATNSFHNARLTCLVIWFNYYIIRLIVVIEHDLPNRQVMFYRTHLQGSTITL